MQKINNHSAKKRNVIIIVSVMLLVTILVFSKLVAGNSYRSIGTKNALETFMAVVVKANLFGQGPNSMEYMVRLQNTIIDNCKKAESLHAQSSSAKSIRCLVSADIIITHKIFHSQETRRLQNCPFIFSRGENDQSPYVYLGQRKISSCLAH